MCFPDKIILVPAPLNQNRHQLASGMQGAASPLHGQQVELVSVCQCVRVSVAVCTFAGSHLKQG